VAQFFTNFSEYTTGQAPSDWTARWVTANVTYTVQADAGATGGKVLRAVVGTLGRHAISWDDVGTPGTVELLLKMRVSALTDNTTMQGPVVRGSGAAASETGYGALAVPVAGNSDLLPLREYNGGAITDNSQVLTGTAFAINTWYWVRLRAVSGDFDWLVWQDGEAEPGTFGEAADASTATGWAGIIAATVGTHEFDIFSAGTGGDPAPSAALGPGKGTGGKGKGGNTPGPGEPPKKPLRTSLSKSWKWDRGWR
jgi:hypothetical protein